jgi:hypothetical protein
MIATVFGNFGPGENADQTANAAPARNRIE